MSSKEIVQQFMEKLWNQHDLTAVDDFFTEDTIIHSSFKKTKGIMEMKEISRHWLDAFPDLKSTWDDWITEEHKTIVRWHAHGTQLGPFLHFPATGKKISYVGVSMYHLKAGKCNEYWALVDMHSVLNQLMGNEPHAFNNNHQ